MKSRTLREGTESSASSPFLSSLDYECSSSFVDLLEAHSISLAFSTYQANRVVTVGVYDSQLRIRAAHFEQAMGLTRTSSGIAVCGRQAVWNLPANSDIAERIEPLGEHDIAFLARSCHHTGPVLAHDIAFGQGRIWLVNTLFNSLVTLEGDWSFVPRWKPTFISELVPEDRCHLNGVALTEDGLKAGYVTALGCSDIVNGWRLNKSTGGCLINVVNQDVLRMDLSMPHSPLLYKGQLYFLNSGLGTLEKIDKRTGISSVLTNLPGFTRGLDCYHDLGFVGISQVRDSSVFHGLPIQSCFERLRSGIAVINLVSGNVEAELWFTRAIQEIFAVKVLPGWKNPVIIGPNADLDAQQTIWLVPPTLE